MMESKFAPSSHPVANSLAQEEQVSRSDIFHLGRWIVFKHRALYPSRRARFIGDRLGSHDISIGFVFDDFQVLLAKSVANDVQLTRPTLHSTTLRRDLVCVAIFVFAHQCDDP
jgi:hypothetical protein